MIHVWDVSDLQNPALVVSRKSPGSFAHYSCAVSEDWLAWFEVYPGDQQFKVIEASSGGVLFEVPHRGKEFTCEAIARNELKHLVAWVEEPDRFSVRGDMFAIRAIDCVSGSLVLDIDVPKLRRGASMESMGGCALAISPDGSTFAFGTAHTARTLGVLDLNAKKVIWYRINAEHGPYAIVYHTDGKSFFTSNTDGTVARYDTQSGALLSKWGPLTFPSGGGIFPVPVGSAHARLLAIDVSPDGKYLAVDTEASLGVVVYDIATGAEFKRIRASKYPIEGALFFSADSKGIWAGGTADRQLKYFKLAD
jgi:WD40 repeat protein